jgi:elongation factor P
VKSQDLRPGNAIVIDGDIWVVISYEHVKPGKGPAYTQVKLRNIKTGSHKEQRLRSGEVVDEAVLDRREMEYLYTESSGAVFMDSESFDQLTISPEVLGDALLYVKPNTTLVALVYQGSVVNVEVPSTVELEIVETEPGIKDATKTNVLKPAKCETGLLVKVPPFIGQGERIRINTESGEYLSRV